MERIWRKKATYSVAELGLEESTYKVEWAARRDRRFDGTFPDHQTVLRDILRAKGKPVDEEIIQKYIMREFIVSLFRFNRLMLRSYK